MSITPRRRRSDAGKLPETEEPLLEVNEEEVGRLEEEVAQMEQQIAGFEHKALALQKQTLGSLGLDHYLGRKATAKAQDLLHVGPDDIDESEEISKFRSLIERRRAARTQMQKNIDRTLELTQILESNLLGSRAAYTHH